MYSPPSDPFLCRPVPRPNERGNTNLVRAADVLVLKAVWRQTGDRLAVINRNLVGEGEQIGDYKIAKIDAEVVWVEGPLGRESIELAAPTPRRPAAKPTVRQ